MWGLLTPHIVRQKLLSPCPGVCPLLEHSTQPLTALLLAQHSQEKVVHFRRTEERCLIPPVTELVFTLLTTHRVLEADRRLTRSETRSAVLQQWCWTHTRLTRQVSRAPARTGTWHGQAPPRREDRNLP